MSVAVVGVTGLVGQTILKVLEERKTPVRELRPLASQGLGRAVRFQGRSLPVQALSAASLAGTDVAFFAASTSVSEVWAPWARDQGIFVVDKSSRFRMDPGVPLVVPEVNPEQLTADTRLVASPNCSTIQLVMALKPITQHRQIVRTIVSTYQAVSGTGKDAVRELQVQTEAFLADRPVGASTIYPKPIGFNVLPHCDRFMEDDYSGEEWKLMRETTKILDRDLRLSATAVRVPIPIGHSESVYVELDRPADPEEVRDWLRQMPGVEVWDVPESDVYPTPLDARGRDAVLVGRIRRDLHQANGLHLFVVADNLRKGAATNAVQIWEAFEAVR